jgi:hypothetical protein
VNDLPVAGITFTESSGNNPDDGTICTGASAALNASGGTSYVWSTGDNTASVTVSPTTQTSYTVTVTDSNACVTNTSATVSVNSLPTPSVSVADNSGALNDGIILIGASATLTASGGTSYLWDTGATTAVLVASPGSTTTYIVTVTNENGCSATSSSTVTVVLEQLPIITVSETSGNSNNDGNICSGTSVCVEYRYQCLCYYSCADNNHYLYSYCHRFIWYHFLGFNYRNGFCTPDSVRLCCRNCRCNK